MNPGQVDPPKPHDPTGGLPGSELCEYILAEWVKVIVVVVGIGVMPLLIEPNDVDTRPFWVLPLAAGGLAMCVGLFLAWRQGRKRRDAGESVPSQPNSRIIAEEIVPPWRLTVRLRTESLSQDRTPAGAPALPETSAAGKSPFSFANVLISLGVLVLLPGLIALLAQAGRLEYAQRIAWFFSTPALLIWAAAEAIDLYTARTARPWKGWEWAGLVNRLLQIAAAALLLIYLGLAYSMASGPIEGPVARLARVDWLLCVGAGLVVLAAILGSLPQVILSPAFGGRQHRSQPRAKRVE